MDGYNNEGNNMGTLKEVAEAISKIASIKLSVGTLFALYIVVKVYQSKGDAIVHFVMGGITGLLAWIF